MSNVSPKRAALKLLQEALDTGVRGNARTYIKLGIDELNGSSRKELTALEYDRLEDGKVLLDPNRPGLLMRAGGRKGKRWIYRYRDPARNNKQVEYQFGSYPEMTVADARVQWMQLREMKNAGQSIRTNSGGGAALTMHQLARLYLDEYSGKKKRHSTYLQDKQLLGRYVLPHYGDMPALQFGRDEAKAIVNMILKDDKPRQAGKVKSTLSSMFNVACKSSYEWLPPDHRNPVYNIDADYTAPKRDPISDGVLRDYLAALPEIGMYGDVLRFQAETMARINEAAGVPWSEIDLEAGVWQLPGARAKNHMAHKVMLSRQTLAYLRDRKATSTSEYVFPSAQNPVRPVPSAHVLNRLKGLRRAGRSPEHFTSHMIRHAATTWIAEQGATLDIRDRLLNHKPGGGGVDHVYNAARHDKAAREWVQRWCDHLTGLESGNVVQMKGGGHVA